MPAVSAPAKVLVTGASGFLAVHVVTTLLESGYEVVGTVRSESKGTHLTKTFAQYKGKFSLVVVPDLEREDAFDEAVKGVDAVLHTASPFHMTGVDPSEYIGPAVAGTIGVLKSAAAHGSTVKRVVVTASLASILSTKTGPYTFTEADWNEESNANVEKLGAEASQIDKYYASKTLAEKAAWKWYEEDKATIGFDLSIIHPPWIFGPMLQEVSSLSALNTSNGYLFGTLQNVADVDAVGQCQGGYVDVRDAATAHVLALEKEKAAGQRIILTAEMWSIQDLYDALRAANVPNLPKDLPSTKQDKSQWTSQDNSRAKNILGLTYRPFSATAVDTVSSIRERFPEAA